MEERVDYLVIEKGIYMMDCGQILEVGEKRGDKKFRKVTFEYEDMWTIPVVFHQMQHFYEKK